MTREEWAEIAQRLVGIWGPRFTDEMVAGYYAELAKLPRESVAEAVRALNRNLDYPPTLHQIRAEALQASRLEDQRREDLLRLAGPATDPLVMMARDRRPTLRMLGRLVRARQDRRIDQATLEACTALLARGDRERFLRISEATLSGEKWVQPMPPASGPRMPYADESRTPATAWFAAKSGEERA